MTGIIQGMSTTTSLLETLKLATSTSIGSSFLPTNLLQFRQISNGNVLLSLIYVMMMYRNLFRDSLSATWHQVLGLITDICTDSRLLAKFLRTFVL